jgi:hypothetical protein
MPFFRVEFTKTFDGWVKAKTKEEAQHVINNMQDYEIDDMDPSADWDTYMGS